MNQYRYIIAGGTFDYFHKGHALFLRTLFAKSHFVLLGITTDSYVKTHKQPDGGERFEKRKKDVESFLRKEGFFNRTKILPIDSVYYPRIWERHPLDAIAVTLDTVQGATQVNEDRKNRGLLPLPVITVDLVKAEDGGYISASRIRSGEINREGRLYLPPVWLKRDFVLPDHLRSQLQSPWGKICTHITRDHLTFYTITVGDEVTKYFNENRLPHIVSVVDFTVQRKKRYSKLSDLGCSGNEIVSYVNNPPGMISEELVNTISRLFKEKSWSVAHILLIQGEEDLSVLPIILAAPLGASVFYGQPHSGMVRIIVSEEVKRRVYSLVSEFEYTHTREDGKPDSIY